MSLCCAECNQDLGPTNELPGREGVMVHPVVMALAYLPTKEEISYQLSPILASQNSALCFECLEKKLPQPRHHKLQQAYNLFTVETSYNRAKHAAKGKVFQTGDLALESISQLREVFIRQLDLREKTCLFCKEEVNKGKPFFIANSIDKAYSEKNLSGISFPPQNYSWSNMEEGVKLFQICFDDFRANFQKTFEQLSYSLTGNKNPNLKLKPNEIYISPEAEQAMEAETGKTLDKFIDEEVKKGTFENIRIIRREK